MSNNANTDKKSRKMNTVRIAVIGTILVAVILVAGTVWLGHTAKTDAESAVGSVSLLYLDELAGRREQVVAANLQRRIGDISSAIELMTDVDLSSPSHLRAYQARMKKLYTLEKFAFVDESGLICTSLGTRENIADYDFDYKTISGPEISVLNEKDAGKRVVIAVPTERVFGDVTLTVCFMEIDMAEMLRGVSMESGSGDATFCNIYTSGGEALRGALDAAEQASRAKSAFLSNMSHEIRTPMNAIIGLDSIALNDPDISPKTRDHLTKIGDSAEHLLHLINDILDMTRIESGKLVLKNEEFSFPKLLEYINTTFSGQCADKGLDYNCQMTGEVDDYYIGDSVKLRQVLINILSNAVKFTPAGGKVELGVERTAQFDGNTTLRFTIKDSGIGMSEEFLPHIFDAFTQEDSSSTNRYGSSGLGLAITKTIVEMMNGTILVESEKGKGTTFTVTVTLLDAKERGTSDEAEIDPTQMTVLIIDDDPVACEHAKLVLEKVGIASETVNSGEEAISLVELRHARRDPYNLILVDWKMPGMDGVETTRRIREIVGHESAIIILTAYKWDDVLDEAVRARVDSFTAKPLFAVNVMEEFKAAVRRKNLSAGDVEKAELSGRTVLVAEDVEINAEIISMTLELKGVSTELASNGRIAVDMFSSHEAGYYSAILMDMRMPEMDGLEATRVIRAMDRPDAKKIPIIALTANAFDEDVQRSLQAGLNAHLSKPVKPEALFETLEELIGAAERDATKDEEK